MVAKRLRCLVVRQPYASLITFGRKRWEFRSYECKMRGKIGIAASHNRPLTTLNEELNGISASFPRGVLLATARIDGSFLVTNNELKANFKRTARVVVHGHELVTLEEPIGEPVEDVQQAILDPDWVAYVWKLTDVKPLRKYVPVERPKRSTWTFLELHIGDVNYERI